MTPFVRVAGKLQQSHSFAFELKAQGTPVGEVRLDL